MFFRRYSGIVFIVLIILLPCYASSFAAEQGVVDGNLRLYLFKSDTGLNNTGVNAMNVAFGDTLTIDVHIYNSRNDAVAGLGIYLTVDDRYFDIVPQGTNEKGSMRPFQRGDYMTPAGNPSPYDPVGNWTNGDTLSAADNGMDGWQLDYVQVSGVVVGGVRPSSSLRYGTASTFQLVAKAPCDSVTIKLDSDNYNGRISSYLMPGSNDTYSFRSFQTCYISVTGIQITPSIPDIRMLAGATDSTLDLDDHVGLSSVPDSALTWSVAGGTNIVASVDSVTHIAKFTAPADFHGSENFIFTVGNGAGVSTSDTMQVTVDSPPDLVTAAFPDTIQIYEDSLTAVLPISAMVTDPDDNLSALTWFFTSATKKLAATVSNDSLRLKGTLNYNGIEALRVSVYDPSGLGDSLTVPVKVIAVNDPPVFSTMPDVSIQRTASYALNVASYAVDADGDTMALTWAAPTHLVISRSGMVLTISGVPGYLGSERLRLTVTDPGGLSDTDSLLITLTKATNPPVWSTLPKAGMIQNHSDSSVVIWNYVTDPDDADSLLTFTFSNLDAIDNATVSPRNGRMILSDTDNKKGWDRLAVTVTDPDGNSATTRFLAFVCAADSSPLVAGLRDTVVVAGNQMQWIDLDDYYFDIGSSNSMMTWTWSRLGASADSSATAGINASTHVVFLRGIDAEKIGINQLIFTVTDPDGKTGQDTCVVTAVLLTTPTVYLPAKVGFPAGGSYSLDLDDYVTDMSYPQTDLTWSWSGNSKATIALTTPDASNTRPIQFSGASSWTGWERVVFSVQNPLGGTAQDTMLVFSATSGGPPVAGGVGTITMKAGSGIYLSLDNYVYDVDTPDNALKWSVSGGDSVKVAITSSSRVAYISTATDTWEGQNTLTFTVTDTDNSSATMNVIVVVTDAVARNVFSLSLFRNPMQEDYIDLYVASDSTLSTTPTAKIYAASDSATVTLKTVSSGYYHGNYVLPLNLSVGQKDSADISVRGKTAGGKNVSEVRAFAYGKIDSSGAKLALSRIVLDIPAGALTSPQIVTLIPSGTAASTAKTVSGEIKFAGPRAAIGPRILSSKCAMNVSFPLDVESSGACVFRMTDDGPVFAGADVSSGSVGAEITNGGVFALGFDRMSPVIRLANLGDGTVRIVLSDGGSGLDTDAFRVTCGGDPVPFLMDADSVITVDLNAIDPGAGAELAISAADRAGNVARQRIVVDASMLPLRLAVDQNTPNPFNPSTHISFSLSRESDVRVEVFDVIGRRIAVLANRPFSAGNHEVRWDARDHSGREVSSGAYFCRVTAGPRVETRKMLFLR